ncbi:YdgA family protein [Marinobacter sp. AN1]|uniref:YdgA family protein n=1 Tax=Marinobacter sp. AN1 TaxID=2886046 RepID=UPI00222F55C4|nr:YdgA family protein [Marinobacter sp. AN1]UZD65354.1 YdgA family protein [Marinobacter sp. AN1]
MKKVWIIAGGVVLVAAVSAPWAVGKLTEQHWQSATEQFNASQPYFVMETESYERGYLGSEAHGQLFAVDPDTGERYPLGWTGDISHGVTSSTIDFDFDFADDAGMEAVFPDEKPTVTVTTSAWGSSLVELNVPAIDYTDDSSGESLNVSASYATLNISEDGETLDARMQLPGLVLRGPDVRVSMENLNLDQHASLLTGKLWTGEATVTLDKVSVTSRDEPELVLENWKWSAIPMPTVPVKNSAWQQR